MKKAFVLLASIVTLLCGSLAPSAHARVTVTSDFFYDSLDPYGTWIEVADYGYCWHPSGIDRDWAPYTDGYWTYTDAGWTWVSYEDFGWITYHYGRWVNIEDEGWLWVPDPDNVWAPAWVSWRSSDDYIGWAPLPPRARFRVTIGFSSWVDDEYDIGPRYYNFCGVRDLGSPALRPVIIDRRRNITIINQTINITNITIRKETNIVFNGGPRFDVVSARSARPIQTLKLVQRREGDWKEGSKGRFLAQQQGNQLIVAAPEIDAREGKGTKPNKVEKSISNPKVDNGWAHIDPRAKDELRKKIKADAGGVKPENAPAKPVDANEVKIVEERIKRGPVVVATPQPGEKEVGKKTTQPGETVTPGHTPQPGQSPVADTQGKGKKQRGETVTPGHTPQPGQSPVADTQGKGKKQRGETVTPGHTPQLGQSPVADAQGKGKKKETTRKGLEPFIATPQPQATAVQMPSSDQGLKRRKEVNVDESPGPKGVPRGESLKRNPEADPAILQKRELDRQRAVERQQQDADAAVARQRSLEKQQRDADAAVVRQRSLERQQQDAEAAAARQRSLQEQKPVERGPVQPEMKRRTAPPTQVLPVPRPGGGATAPPEKGKEKKKNKDEKEEPSDGGAAQPR